MFLEYNDKRGKESYVTIQRINLRSLFKLEKTGIVVDVTLLKSTLILGGNQPL